MELYSGSPFFRSNGVKTYPSGVAPCPRIDPSCSSHPAASPVDRGTSSLGAWWPETPDLPLSPSQTLFRTPNSSSSQTRAISHGSSNRTTSRKFSDASSKPLLDLHHIDDTPERERATVGGAEVRSVIEPRRPLRGHR